MAFVKQLDVFIEEKHLITNDGYFSESQKLFW
jgi:hypothetical protein